MHEFSEISTGRVLVVTPHSDDETLGCGGTIARLIASGADVGVLLVSTADVDHYGESRGLVSAEVRAKEFNDAMGALGVTQTEILFPNSELHMRLDTMAKRELVGALEKGSSLSLDNFAPRTVLLPASSYNQDHEALHHAVITACRPHLAQHKPFVRHVLSYEQPQLGWGPTSFVPNIYVDISDFLAKKLEAYGHYRSQQHPDPHHGSAANLERMARFRGSEVSVKAAEAFHTHRMVL